MDLYSITIMFKNSANVVRLMFKNGRAAEDVFGGFDLMAAVGAWTATDDYGKRCVVRYDEYAAIAFAHTNKELNAAQDEQILQAHAQVALNKRAKSDTVLSAATREPSIVAPFSNGGMRQ